MEVLKGYYKLKIFFFFLFVVILVGIINGYCKFMYVKFSFFLMFFKDNEWRFLRVLRLFKILMLWFIILFIKICFFVNFVICFFNLDKNCFFIKFVFRMVV